MNMCRVRCGGFILYVDLQICDEILQARCRWSCPVMQGGLAA